MMKGGKMKGTAAAHAPQKPRRTYPSHIAAVGLEDEEPAAGRVPSDGVRSVFRRDRLQMDAPAYVEHRDRSGAAHSDVEAAELAVVHDHVRSTRQRKGRLNCAGIAIDH